VLSFLGYFYSVKLLKTMSLQHPKTIAGITIPDSSLAKAATDLLLTHGTEFLYNHSLRVYLFATLNATRQHIAHDAELLYISSVFHDLGLTKQYSRTDFKKNIIPTFFSGFAHKTDTTFGNIKADVCAFMIPNFERKNFCDCILHSPWHE